MRIRLDVSHHYDELLGLAVDSAFDWVYYAASNYVRLSVIPSSEPHLACNNEKHAS